MIRRFLLAVSVMSSLAAQASTASLSDSQALEIGRRIWKNECAGTVSGLTSWNKGEEFPSLGIAHFIWLVAQAPSRRVGRASRGF
jgi:hypothetical protein